MKLLRNFGKALGGISEGVFGDTIGKLFANLLKIVMRFMKKSPVNISEWIREELPKGIVERNPEKVSRKIPGGISVWTSPSIPGGIPSRATEKNHASISEGSLKNIKIGDFPPGIPKWNPRWKKFVMELLYGFI